MVTSGGDIQICTKIEGIRAICVTCGALVISNNGNGDKTISPSHFTLSSEERNRLGRIFCEKCRAN
jgi:hypothetical protein